MTDMTDDKKNSFPYHRRYARYPVRLRIRVSALEDYDTWTENLSFEGVCFVIPGQIEEGKSVEINISLRNKQPNDLIQCSCKIVWGEELEKGRRYGGQFTSFKDDDQARLKEYLTKF
ncbi:MAG: PilZ domain-containing protein [Deltaproteobacteria bacterium]|nr:PilZ domain-containing protein [Deltaproteobacteria bacterium]MBW1873275.1 PilZ domain-containing protein [Deltaproteobacteria bacterium]